VCQSAKVAVAESPEVIPFETAPIIFSGLRNVPGKQIAHAFDVLRLHRIQANYVPDNVRSGRLLQRLGFRKEGFAADYLFINGAWRDHVLTALLNPRFDAAVFGVVRPKVAG